jgi:hypothetical protein
LFRNNKFKEFLGIPKYLPGSKLERQMGIAKVEILKPQTFTSKPSTKQKIADSAKTLLKK